jgi:quinoprotein glucose dehydrogenase
VHRSLSACVALAVLAPLAGQQKLDLSQQQSPPKPRPRWLQIIDQGANDPRLKGYFTPTGIKVEIVAQEPTVINPVGMTFAPDGTLYLLEWVPATGPDFIDVDTIGTTPASFRVPMQVQVWEAPR